MIYKNKEDGFQDLKLIFKQKYAYIILGIYSWQKVSLSIQIVVLLSKYTSRWDGM